VKIFLAAPLFNKSQRDFNAKIAKKLRDEGFDVWLAQEHRFISKGTRREKEKIFQEDIQALRESDIVVGVLDGKDVDAGTAFELGCAYILGKKLVGLKTDYRTFSKIENVNLIIETPLSGIYTKIEDAIALLKKSVKFI
jgi:nucleoside 2-deoxyribosyltransferase